jgi:hypothetical protein
VLLLLLLLLLLPLLIRMHLMPATAGRLTAKWSRPWTHCGERGGGGGGGQAAAVVEALKTLHVSVPHTQGSSELCLCGWLCEL